MDLDRQSDIDALDTTLTTVERVIDVDELRATIERLENEAADPKLWDDQANAQKVTSELSHAQADLRRIEGLRGRLDDLPVLYEMAVEEQGAGGQSVNTTDSAVRLTHIPTNIVVTCQNEKSQLQNKVSAMRVLQAKLLERKRHEERAEMDALKGDGGSSWGNQMRSYVLHPYQMVKDLRTEYEVGNPSAVLDGDIDGFLEAGIRWRNRRDDD